MTAIDGNVSGTRRVAKLAYHAARNLPDRLLHNRRHRIARRRAAARLGARSILVVCYGNVCRSPYMEAILRRDLPNVAVMSAGFVGSDRPAPAASLSLSAERGLDLTAHRSRPLSPSEVTGADLIIVMDADQSREVCARFLVDPGKVVIAGDLDPRFAERRAILDPWNQRPEVFAASFDRLDRC